MEWVIVVIRRDGETQQPHSSTTTLLRPAFHDASVDGRETRSFDGISSYQHAMKILSSEVLTEKEIRSAMASSAGSNLSEVQSPVADQASNVRDFGTRPGLLAVSWDLKAYPIHIVFWLQ